MPRLDLTFDPPGPGAWVTDPNHVPRPVSPMYLDTVGRGVTRGFGESNRRVGLFVGSPRVMSVHGFRYGSGTSVPEFAPGIEPSRVEYDRAVASDPEAQLRIQNAARFFEERLWRADLQRWDSVTKPGLLAAGRALATVEPAALDDAQLLAHVSDCRAYLEYSAYVHHSLNTGFAVSGEFLRKAAEWTGDSPHALAALLGGASAVSAGESALLDEVAAALRADQVARTRLATGEAGEALAAVRAMPGEVGRTLHEYLLVTGYRRVGGFDCADSYALEHPEQLRETVTHASDHGAIDAAGALVDPTPIRAKVAEAARAEFDKWLVEARLNFRMRDERVVHGEATALGLVRRALLEAGSRLAARGVIADREHAVLASEPEIHALIAGQPQAIPETLHARYEFRETYTVRDIPRSIGTPAWRPPTDWLPENVRRATIAVATASEVMLGAVRLTERGAAGETIKGISASLGMYRGTARLVCGPADFGRIQQGDVVVTTSTSPAFAVVLPLIGALVTDVGGALSHAAIVARECRIPAIVGCGNATTSIPDGATVLVDAGAGTVTIEG